MTLAPLVIRDPLVSRAILDHKARRVFPVPMAPTARRAHKVPLARRVIQVPPVRKVFRAMMALRALMAR